MSELKTTRTDADVDEFLSTVDDERRRRDAFAVKDLMTRVTGQDPEMWGPSIVGFLPYRYTAKSGGTEQEWFKIGFSPRKHALSIYLTDGFEEYGALLDELGEYSTGKACLYVKDLEKVDIEVLTELIERSVAHAERHATD